MRKENKEDSLCSSIVTIINVYAKTINIKYIICSPSPVAYNGTGEWSFW